MDSETMLTQTWPRDKSPLLDAQRRFELVTLHHTAQQAQHNINWAIPDPTQCKWLHKASNQINHCASVCQHGRYIYTFETVQKNQQSLDLLICGKTTVCLSVASRPSNMPVYLRDGFAQTKVCAAILREVADQTFYLTQSQYTDTRPTSPSTDPRHLAG